MNYQTVQNLLKEIPEISRGLKNNNPEAKKDMNIDAISEDMHKTLGEMAILERKKNKTIGENIK